MLSQFVKKYLQGQTPKSNQEKEAIINFLIDKNAIQENDKQEARRYLRVHHK